MKNLILGNCDHLMKFILFGDEDDSNNQKEIKHLPRSILWKKSKKFVKGEKEDKYLEFNRTLPTNDMELAIYHCKG